MSVTYSENAAFFIRAHPLFDWTRCTRSRAINILSGMESDPGAFEGYAVKVIDAEPVTAKDGAK